MADTPQTLALITVAQNYRNNIVRQINRRSALMRVIPIVPGEGKNCAFVVEQDGAVSENYAEGADASNFGSDAQAEAILSWGLYRDNFKVTGLAMAAAATSRTPQGNVQLWARNLINASSKLASTINGVLFSGAGTGTTIAGLGVAIGDATNTYAGIDRSTATYWRPIVVDPGSLTAPTLSLIRDDVRQIFEASGENPDIAVVSPAVFNVLGGLFDPQRQYASEVTTARGTVTLDMGFKGLVLDDMVFIKDKDCTANRIYYLNTNHVRIEYLPTASPGVAKVLEQQIPADDGFGQLPLGLTYEALAKTGDADKAMVKTYLQLVVDKPNSCGCRKNVAV